MFRLNMFSMTTVMKGGEGRGGRRRGETMILLEY